MIELSHNIFSSNGYWQNGIYKKPTVSDLDLFDQNGYDLTLLEQYYAIENDTRFYNHRPNRIALKKPWFTQSEKIEGAVLNHSVLFERKGYIGEALEQLTQWAKELPLIHKIISVRPKWGLDFSMDYVDRKGNAFEILHWEYDGFDYEDVQVYKLMMQANFATIDWEDAGKKMLSHKDEWHHLDFFQQSDWKCNYFNIPKEKFKMVIWK